MFRKKKIVQNSSANEGGESSLILQGKILFELLKKNSTNDIHDYEFGVTSQWGEDGIIQYLISQLPGIIPIFIEFGVEDYTEANTRFLLQNNNWKGNIFDGSEDNVKAIKQSNLYWKYDLIAIQSFITVENINDLLSSCIVNPNVGILSIDIDGNDYWVFKEIDVVAPQIIICEYNSLFGPEAKITVPYEADFVRNEKHYSNLFYGASIAAITDLAKQKGYSLVGSNTAGNNLFFVRDDYADKFTILSPQEAYVKSRFRESRDIDGKLTWLNHEDALFLIEDCLVFDTEIGKSEKLLNYSKFI